MAQLGLALTAQGGPHEHRQALLGQLVGDQLAVGAVVQGGLHPEFLGNPHGGEDVVGPVGVALQGDLAVDHRQHGLQLHVEGGILPGQLIVPVALGLEQQLPQQRRHGHAGHGAFLQALAIAALGILAEGALHGGRLLQQHIVHPLACHEVQAVVTPPRMAVGKASSWGLMESMARSWGVRGSTISL